MGIQTLCDKRKGREKRKEICGLKTLAAITREVCFWTPTPNNIQKHQQRGVVNNRESQLRADEMDGICSN